MATEQMATEQIPLRKDTDGTIRVGKTRVTLDCVATAFEEGATPESIVDQFPSLQLPDVYLVLGYYLRHTQEIADYLAEGRRLAQEHQRRAEARLSPFGIRERLLARRSERKE